MAEFKRYPRIKRSLGLGNMLITEKIDGTNAMFVIEDKKLTLLGTHRRQLLMIGDPKLIEHYQHIPDLEYRESLMAEEPRRAHFGFVGWCEDHKEELESIGDGVYYGEWVTPEVKGCQRYPYEGPPKLFLFCPQRWPEQRPQPACLDLVPTLYRGPFNEEMIQTVIDELDGDSVAFPGSDNPEGIIIELLQLKKLCKWTFGGNTHKWMDK